MPSHIEFHQHNDQVSVVFCCCCTCDVQKLNTIHNTRTHMYDMSVRGLLDDGHGIAHLNLYMYVYVKSPPFAASAIETN